MPDRDYMAHLYGAASLADQDAAARDRGLSVRQEHASEVEQLLVHLGRPPSRVRVHDFGSGSGLWLEMAAARGCDVAGAELNASVVRRIQALGFQAFVPGNQTLDTFDYVNAVQGFEHLSDPRSTIVSLVGSLRSGGIVRFSAPNGSRAPELLHHPDWSVPKSSPRSLNPVAPLEHVNCFTHTSLGTAARGGDI